MADGVPRGVALIVNNEGHVVGGMSVEPDCGSERILEPLALLCEIFDLHVVVTTEHYVAVLPNAIQDELREFMSEHRALLVDAFKRPGRG